MNGKLRKAIRCLEHYGTNAEEDSEAALKELESLEKEIALLKALAANLDSGMERERGSRFNYMDAREDRFKSEYEELYGELSPFTDTFEQRYP